MSSILRCVQAVDQCVHRDNQQTRSTGPRSLADKHLPLLSLHLSRHAAQPHPRLQRLRPSERRDSQVLPSSVVGKQHAQHSGVCFTCAANIKGKVVSVVNPLEIIDNYSVTSNNMKLVYWPLMGRLLHLVQ